MFSKVKLLFLPILIIALSSCSWFRDNPNANGKKVIQYDLNGGECLKDWSGRLSRYFSGAGDYEQVNEFWGCLDSVVNEFQKQVRTSDKEGYKIEKLRILIQKYFLNKKEIPDQLVNHLVLLKQAIFGGDLEYLSFKEIERLHLFIHRFWDSSLKLLPHASILSLKESRVSDNQVYQAVKELGQQAKHWSETLGEIHQSYEIDNLMSMWNELHDYFDIPNNENDKVEFDKKLVLIKALKSVVINPPENRILRGDWARLYNKLGKAWGAYVSYNYLIQDNDLENLLKAPNLSHVQVITEIFLGELLDGAAHHDQNIISQKELSQVFSALKALKVVIPENIKMETIDTTLKNLFHVVLREKLELPAGTSSGLSKAALERLNFEVGSWFLHQHFVSKVFEGDRDFESRANILSMARSWQNNKSWGRSFYNVMAQFKLGPTMLDDSLLRQIGYDAKLIERHDFMSLTYLNAINSTLRMVLQGYTTTFERSQNAMSIAEGEFQKFYEDFHPLGVDLGLLDPVVKTAGRRTFKESNLFTTSGNGDPWMTPTEGAEEISLLMSGGRMAKIMHEKMRFLCNGCAEAELDVFGFARLNRQYVFESLEQNYKEFFRGLPNLRDFYSSLHKYDRRDFINNYVEAALASPELEVIGLPELRVFSVLLHFTESLMLKFDRNKSGELDVFEIEGAFSTFYMLFSEVWRKETGKEGGDDDLMAVFVYLLHNGEVLKAGDTWRDKVWAWNTLRKYKKNRRQMGISVDRRGLARVFKVMKKHLSR